MSSESIYVDLDDVLCETGRGFVEVLRTEFGKAVDFEAIHSFDLGISFGLDREELHRFMKVAHEPEVLLGMHPIEGAAEALEGWRSSGYEVRVVTGRPPETEEISRRWLADRKMPYDELTFVDKYSRELPDWTESSVLKLDDLGAENFSFAVEDSLRVARYLAEELGFQVVLLDRPWNQEAPGEGLPLDGRLVRCRSWSEIQQWHRNR